MIKTLVTTAAILTLATQYAQSETRPLGEIFENEHVVVSESDPVALPIATQALHAAQASVQPGDPLTSLLDAQGQPAALPGLFTGPSSTGLVSSTSADQGKYLDADGNFSDPVANLTPADVGALPIEAIAEGAYRLWQADGNSWLDLVNGTGTLYRVTSSNVVTTVADTNTIVIVDSDNYNGPDGPFNFSGIGFEIINYSANEEGWDIIILSYEPPFAEWNLYAEVDAINFYEWNFAGVENELDMPATSTSTANNATGTVTIDYEIYNTVTNQVPVTNSVAIATLPDLQAAIASLAEDYTPTAELHPVALSGDYNALEHRPVLLASNDVFRAAHWGSGGDTDWTGWDVSGDPSVVDGALRMPWESETEYAYQLENGIAGWALDFSSVEHPNLWWSTNQVDWASISGPLRFPVWIKLTIGTPPPTFGGGSATDITRLTIDSYESLAHIGKFPLRGIDVEVDIEPQTEHGATSKHYVDNQVAPVDAKAEQALKWWEQIAEGDAHMDGNRLHLGGGWSLLGPTDGYAALSFGGAVLTVQGDEQAQFALQLAAENVLTARFDTDGMAILGWSGPAENMWLDVSTNGLHESEDAWVEYAATMTAGVWARVPTQSMSAISNNQFRISFENPRWGEDTAFFRVLTPANDLAALRSTVPLRAPSMMLSESNSVETATFPGVLTFENVVDVPSAVAGHGHVYVHNGEVYAMDEDGNAQQLSSHREGRPVLHEFNVYSGWGTRIDWFSALAGDADAIERYRLPESQRRNWQADQAALAIRSADARAQWQSTPAHLRRTPEPALRQPAPMPEWLREHIEADADPLDADRLPGKVDR